MTTNYLTTLSTHHSTIEFCLYITKTLRHLKQTHARLLRTSQHPHHLLTQLISTLLNLPGNNLLYARQLFDQIPHCHNQFLWTSFIRSHTQNAHFTLSISFYAKMHRLGVYPNKFTFSSTLNACARIPAVLEGKQVHTRVVESGYCVNDFVQTALLDMYAKCGCAEDARKVFDLMGERDVVAWTAMVSGYAKIGMMEDARKLFDVMVERNVVSWTAMVAGYANCGDIKAAKELFDEMPVRNSITWTAMIAGYGKVGDVMKAEQVFNRMRVQDPTSRAAMIACYAQNGWFREAIEMYKRIMEVNEKPTEVATVGAISACTQVGDVDTGDRITEYMEKWGSAQSLVVSNALIHMHAKCGSIYRALDEFNGMPYRDVISYTALITALADHGKADEALDLFSRMQKDEIEPNEITFVGVLNACSHAGLVNEGYRYFELMRKMYDISPSTRHYACMVDLLARAGRLKDAYMIILESVGEPDAGVWGALLGACRLHGNAEIGEIAAKHLFDIEPENTGNYALLASLYASVDRWGDAAEVRKMMGARGIRKSPGCSWISSEQKSSAQVR